MVMGELTQDTELVVIGGGPGGYAAAFRAADLGLDVTLVEREAHPGGVCLFRGCIPSKTLLSLAELILDSQRAEQMGVDFSPPKIDLEKLRSWKDQVISRLANGLVNLCKKRGVQLIRATATFENSELIRLHDTDLSHIKFRHAILATGSLPVPLPGQPFRPGSRIMDSTGALALLDIPRRLLVIGGGYIALELGTAYAALGSRVSVVVRGDRLLRGIDSDLVKPLKKHLESLFEAIYFNTTVAEFEEHDDRVDVSFSGAHNTAKQSYDRILVAIGRRPNSASLGLENTEVQLDEHGYVIVDDHQRTSDGKIYAVGDVTGGVLLAHKAMREGKVAAEVIAGQPSAYDVRAMPAVVFTDPQVAWAGLTEEDARHQQRPVKVARFPWSASGRAVTMGAYDGLTKILFEPETERVLGIGIVGRGAEALVAEGTLAIEMGAVAEDLALTIHPHPTLSETEGEAAELFLGSATHIFSAWKKRN